MGIQWKDLGKEWTFCFQVEVQLKNKWIVEGNKTRDACCGRIFSGHRPMILKHEVSENDRNSNNQFGV